MKKLFGISLVAVLAVSPLMAGATDLTSEQLAKANISNPADSQTVATVSYVKGAYDELGTAINTKQDKLSADQLSAIQNAASQSALEQEIEARENADETIWNTIGDGSLTTNNQNLVGAINEVRGTANGAVQEVVEGTTNGTVSVDGTDVAVHGLGSAAYTDSTAYDAAGTAQSLVNGLGIADYAKKTGVTATITASTISGTVPVLATWGNSTATTAPISASITGAAYTEPVAQPAQQGNN